MKNFKKKLKKSAMILVFILRRLSDGGVRQPDGPAG